MAKSPTVEEMYHRTEEDSIGFTTLLKYENLHNAESMDMTPDESPKRFSEGSSDDIHVCFACGDVITERFLLKVNDRSWHSGCLRCCMCHAELDRQTSCFIKADNVYCKGDYTRQFGTKCAKCLRTIQSNDWVRRAKDNVYHLACFACDSCKRQLSTGEEFALQDNKVLCKTHYVELLEGGSTLDSESSQRKSKRVRTTFTEEQVQVLQANFQLDSNPDGQDLERIAQITGLSKRVTQVWFQNSRARQKKYQNLKNTSNNSHTSRGHGGPGSPMSGIHGCNSYSCSDIDSSPGDWDSSLGTDECVINYSM